MKKTISWILIVTLCMALCACSSKESSEPAETIPMDTLLTETDNAAQAQLEVNKGTTIFGQIDSISTTNCKVNSLFQEGAFVYIEMPIEQLAELKTGTFIAVKGIVSSYNEEEKRYTVTATETLDMQLMDDYVKEKVSIDHQQMMAYVKMTTDPDEIAGFTHSFFIKEYNLNTLYKYVSSRPDAFLITDNEALKTYLTGTWVWGQGAAGIFKSNHVELKADGTASWYEYISIFEQDTFEGTWSVDNGCISPLWNGTTKVYVLRDDVFITGNSNQELFIKHRDDLKMLFEDSET